MSRREPAYNICSPVWLTDRGTETIGYGIYTMIKFRGYFFFVGVLNTMKISVGLFQTQWNIQRLLGLMDSGKKLTLSLFLCHRETKCKAKKTPVTAKCAIYMHLIRLYSAAMPK